MKFQESYKFKQFLFPLFPHKVHRSTKLMMIIASLIAIRILLGYFHIKLPVVNETIGFAWVPIMICGWFFGPIVGCVFGAVTDTLGFVLHPSVWFWMYAIQEPCVGLIAGVIRGICYLRINKKSQSITLDLFVQQIFILLFCLVAVFGMFFWLDGVSFQKFQAYKIVVLVLITAFLIMMETTTFVFIKNSDQKNHWYRLVFLYGTMIVALTMTLFSFLLGPIAAVEYLKYINHYNPDKDTLVFLLIPRIIVQSVKVPIESFILATLIVATSPLIKDYLNILNNKWENN